MINHISDEADYDGPENAEHVSPLPVIVVNWL